MITIHGGTQTGATLTLPSGVSWRKANDQIVSAKGMSVFAVGRGIFSGVPLAMFQARDWLKMIRVYASAILASMVKLFSWRVENFVHKSMNRLAFPVNSDFPVPLVVDVTHPYPASRWVKFNVSQYFMWQH